MENVRPRKTVADLFSSRENSEIEETESDGKL